MMTLGDVLQNFKDKNSAKNEVNKLIMLQIKNNLDSIPLETSRYMGNELLCRLNEFNSGDTYLLRGRQLSKEQKKELLNYFISKIDEAKTKSDAKLDEIKKAAEESLKESEEEKTDVGAPAVAKIAIVTGGIPANE